MKAISSAFCAEVLTGSGHVSVRASRVTTAYLAKCVPYWTQAAIHEILNNWMTNGLAHQV
jgi:hypothetical protein